MRVSAGFDLTWFAISKPVKWLFDLSAVQVERIPQPQRL